MTMENEADTENAVAVVAPQLQGNNRWGRAILASARAYPGSRKESRLPQSRHLLRRLRRVQGGLGGGEMNLVGAGFAPATFWTPFSTARIPRKTLLLSGGSQTTVDFSPL